MGTYKNNIALKLRQNELEVDLKKMHTMMERFKRELKYNSRNLGGVVAAPEEHHELDQLKNENIRLRQKIEAFASVKKIIQTKKSTGPAKSLAASIKKVEESRAVAEMSENDRNKVNQVSVFS